MTDRDYMLRAIELAKKGAGHTNPNPMVGAVIVKDGRIIGEGYHAVYGDLHAERNAFRNLEENGRAEDAKGADMYVTLEPCCHYGKQPPCTDAVIAHGIRRVFVGSFDPNPKVAGKGLKLLKDAGIEVVENFMREECDALNPVFFHYISTGKPYIALKYAMTADGKIAAASGKSQWITNEEARAHVHELRNYYKGILVGIGTVLADDPMLTCRMEGGRNPIRIVLDTYLRIPEDSKLVKSAGEVPLIVFSGRPEDIFEDSAEEKAAKAAFAAKKQRLEAAGAEVAEVASVSIGSKDKKLAVSIPDVMAELGQRTIDGVLVEGGGNVHASFVEAGAVNRVYAYVGAKIFGGVSKYTPVSGSGIDEVKDAFELTDPEVKMFGDDLLIRYEVTKRPAKMR